jgi:hypothetical protein
VRFGDDLAYDSALIFVTQTMTILLLMLVLA